jgi:hypothetical protein
LDLSIYLIYIYVSYITKIPLYEEIKSTLVETNHSSADLKLMDNLFHLKKIIDSRCKKEPFSVHQVSSAVLKTFHQLPQQKAIFFHHLNREGITLRK